MAVLLKYPFHYVLGSLGSMSYDSLCHIHLLVIFNCFTVYRHSVSSLTEHKSLVLWKLLISLKKHPWSCTWIFTWAWNKRDKRLKTLLMNLRLVQGWVLPAHSMGGMRENSQGVVLWIQQNIHHANVWCFLAGRFLYLYCHSAVHLLYFTPVKLL